MYVAPSGTACTTFEPVVPETLQYKGRLRLLSRRPVDAAAAAAAEAKTKGDGNNSKGPVSSQIKGCGGSAMSASALLQGCRDGMKQLVGRCNQRACVL